MDQLQISPETQQGLQNLSAKDKQELNQFIVGETQKAQVQSSMSRLPSLQVCAFTRLAHACMSLTYSRANAILQPSTSSTPSASRSASLAACRKALLLEARILA